MMHDMHDLQCLNVGITPGCYIGFLQHIIATLQREFAMTDMGQLHHFLGVSVAHCDYGLFLSQR